MDKLIPGFVVIGTSETTLECVKALLFSQKKVVGIYSLKKTLLPNNSIDLEQYAKQFKIPYFETTDLNSLESVAQLREIAPDYIISTWPRIISEEVIKIPKLMIATHPTPLPYNKGRHPLHWMIAMGISNTMMTFFEMEAGIDSGRILLQVPFNIGYDHIQNVYQRMNKAMFTGISKLVSILEENPSFRGYEQNPDEGNYWRKRTEDDIVLDPRMSASQIKRIVKSFSPPYPMATLYYQSDSFLKITDAKEIEESKLPENWRNFEHGFIIRQFENSIYLKIDDGAIELFFEKSPNSDFKAIKRIHPPTYYFRKS